MSDDPTRPVPGWPEQPPRYRPPGGYDPRDPYRQDEGGGYREDRGGYGNQGGYRDGWAQPERPAQHGDWGQFGDGPDQARGRGSGGRPRRRHRGLKILGVVVVILLILAVVADRVAVKLAENEVADQIKSSGFPVKPSVTIEGFPFLTQVAARNFHQIDLSASNVREGVVEIASIKATLHNVHVTSSFNGATVAQTSGTALVTFAGLSNASGFGSGLSLSNAGHNELKAALNLGPVSTSALAQVARVGSHSIQVTIVSAGDIPLSLLGDHRQFTVSLPNLPAGMTIQTVSVTGQGVLISISGTNTTFSQGS